MEWSVQVEGLADLIAALKAVGGNATPLINTAVKASILEVQRLARAGAPHRTGTLQRSILPEFGSLFGTLTVNESYGVYLEMGTGPFDIRPRNKKALMWPGAAHPVRVVHHPGLKARPFFQPAIDAAQPFMQEQFNTVFETIARNIATRTT